MATKGYVFYTDGSYGRYNLNKGTYGFIGYKFSKVTKDTDKKDFNSAKSLFKNLLTTNYGFLQESEYNKLKENNKDVFTTKPIEIYVSTGVIQGDDCNNYIAEISAINSVLEFCLKEIEEDSLIVIKTDCQSVLVKLETLMNDPNKAKKLYTDIPKDKIVNSIFNNIKNLADKEVKVIFRHVPGHSNIYGNEIIDQICKIRYMQEFIDKKDIITIPMSKLSGKFRLPFYLDREELVGCKGVDNFLADASGDTSKEIITAFNIKQMPKLLKDSIMLNNKINKNSRYLLFFPKMVQTFENLLFSNLFGNMIKTDMSGKIRTLDNSQIIKMDGVDHYVKETYQEALNDLELLNSNLSNIKKVEVTEDILKNCKKKTLSTKVRLIKVDLTNVDIKIDSMLLKVKNDLMDTPYVNKFLAKGAKFYVYLKQEKDLVRYYTGIELEDEVDITIKNTNNNFIYNDYKSCKKS